MKEGGRRVCKGRKRGGGGGGGGGGGKGGRMEG